MNNKKYDYWLACIDGIGDRTIRKLHDNLGDAEAIYYAGEEQIASLTDEKKAGKIICSRNSWNVDSQYQRCIDQGINFLTIDDEEYPDKLKCIPDPPYNIFYKGGLPDEKLKSVAIIGARECSEYGKYVSRTLAGYLGKYGVQIISGMARGVDGISQRAALEEGGTSFGVLGSGVDVCYPKQNRFLYDELIKKGGVISIYRPGVLPQPQNFPPRNRIVSGLADVIVVIEAREKSGTLITVDMALEQGKDVYVVPGRITDRLSDGCNMLAKQGAGIILSPEAFYQELTGVEKNIQKARETAEIMLDFEERAVLDCMDYEPVSVGEIMEKTGGKLGVSALNATLIKLCMEGRIKQVGNGFFSLK